MLSSKISFVAAATGPDLVLTVRFDGKIIQTLTDLSTEPRKIEHDFDDSHEINHLLDFEMSGKTPEHTEIDDNGNILSDRLILISDVCLDGISLVSVFSKVSDYQHDCNGTSDMVKEKFYGVMGCNGRARFRFSSPSYLWLLKHM
jgi:hypothetical protein